MYVELIASPDHARAVGLPEAEHRAGLFAGHRRRARRPRHRGADHRHARCATSGVEAAERTAREAAALAHPYVVGFNMAGDEAGFPPAPFARAFAMAHAAGLGCTVHAGEHAGPASIAEALALPGVTRLSHGVRAVEDPALVARAGRGAGSCSRSARRRTSRSASTAATRSIRSRVLRDAGVRRDARLGRSAVLRCDDRRASTRWPPSTSASTTRRCAA